MPQTRTEESQRLGMRLRGAAVAWMGWPQLAARLQREQVRAAEARLRREGQRQMMQALRWELWNQRLVLRPGN